VVGPELWSSLPFHMRSSIATFKSYFIKLLNKLSFVLLYDFKGPLTCFFFLLFYNVSSIMFFL